MATLTKKPAYGAFEKTLAPGLVLQRGKKEDDTVVYRAVGDYPKLDDLASRIAAARLLYRWLESYAREERKSVEEVLGELAERGHVPEIGEFVGKKARILRVKQRRLELDAERALSKYGLEGVKAGFLKLTGDPAKFIEYVGVDSPAIKELIEERVSERIEIEGFGEYKPADLIRLMSEIVRERHAAEKKKKAAKKR